MIERHVVTTHGRCAALCHDNKRCYAVNIIETNEVVCELSIGLSSEEEMVDDVTSFLYVLGEFLERANNFSLAVGQYSPGSYDRWGNCPIDAMLFWNYNLVKKGLFP